MLSNLMSQQLPTQSIQMTQVEPISNKIDSSMQMGVMGTGSNSPSLQQASMSVQMGMTQPLETVPDNSNLQKASVANMRIGQVGPRANSLMTEQFSLQDVVVSQQSSTMLTKRKAPMEPTSNNPGSQKLSVTNKRVAQTEHRPWLQNTPAPNKLAMQSQPISSPSGLQRSQATFKRSASGKAGLQQLPAFKSQVGQPSPKGQSEPSESVRSKLRESLAAALALVSQEQDTSGKIPKNEDDDTAGPKQELSQPSGHNLRTSDANNHASEEFKQSLHTKDPSTLRFNDDHGSFREVSSYSAGDTAQTLKNDGQLTISMPDEDTSFGDCFFVKDDLLQGNGLSWVLEPEMGMAENRDIETGQKQSDLEDLHGINREQPARSPEIMASEIEAELYKLFGGINKKYKEKGRSLVFNLKDRNNPELRARVMSGEIPPERLCSMTAEELASKELSEWRIAKAEELAQMVVLPDSDVDMRRLVRKTHKGEFQVEVEPEDSVSTEVAIGASSLTRTQPKPKDKEASSMSKPDKMKEKRNAVTEKSSTVDKNVLTIPSNEGTDLMQGLMVDDELRDAEFLPPIVSLDEFMESLNSEPPFENLPMDNRKSTPDSDKDAPHAGSGSKSPDVVVKDRDDTVSGKQKDRDDTTSGKQKVRHDTTSGKQKDRDDTATGKQKNRDDTTSIKSTDVARTRSETRGKSTDHDLKSEMVPPARILKGEMVWEGLLQLNISAMASVIGIFKSGEKTSAKDWPGMIEIKGRVRLDAFEKFLQELPTSRSRAVMAVHFVRKEGSGESDSAGLMEVADSYVMDSRVGFGEPAPGVELYFCPPDSKTRNMLSKVLPKDQVAALDPIDNGLVGVIVWRKYPPQITSTISPRHNVQKQQHFPSRRPQETDPLVNASAEHPLPRGGPPYGRRQPDDNDDDDDDDLPPGFGPPAARNEEEDDLPEFNFSSGPVTPMSQSSNPKGAVQGQGAAHFHPQTQAHGRPVDQMRELVHRYGQPKTAIPSGNWQDKRGVGVTLQPWDDDDDMPEWRPEDNKPQVSYQHSRTQPVHAHGIQQQPILRAPNIVHETPHQHTAHTVHPAVHLQPMHPNMVQETPPQIAHSAIPMHPQANNAIPGQQPGAPSWQVQGPWMAPQNSAPSWQPQSPWMGHHPPPHNPAAYQHNMGQFHGAPGLEAAGQQAMGWRRDAPASRGF